MNSFRVSATVVLIAAHLQLSGTFLGMSTAMAATLEEAITQTLISNPQAQASLNRYQASSEVVKEARGNYLPTLDLKAGAGYEHLDTPVTRSLGKEQESYKPREHSLTLNQNLFDGFATTHQYQKAKEQHQSRREQLRTKAENLALEVASIYLKILEDRQQLDLAKANLQSHERIHKLIQQRFQQGVANQSDLFQIEGRLARAHANLISSRNNLQDSEIHYYRLVNQAPDGLALPVPGDLHLPAELDEAIATALKEHPALNTTLFELRAAQSGYAETRSQFLPRVDLSLSQRWDRDINGQVGKHDDTSAMLTFKYNLFNGGSDSARRQRAAYEVEESRANQQDTRHRVEETVKTAWAELENLAAEQPYLKQHMEASSKAARAYQKQFDLGKRSLLDLLDSENENFQAQRAYTSASHRAIYAHYRVLNGMGQLLNRLHISLPSNWQLSEG